ncbi:sugar phosphate isomerase/epimerase family protein [Thermococcus stetteri]|uniref:sugar phosphate isomerase/epimerase family protein n=1 Tax=Thermococcus stetteri TaxID=49900 RepID=UPI001AEAE376|nr:sugar phosphate isomerase/epimerase family protein [Thermococcus stetteri]MBP1912717.1 sugar phosphate isomerase/epimerase [Thermococcus stetteri]
MIGLSMTAYSGRRLDAFPQWVERVKALGFEGIEIVSEWPHFLTRENLPFFKETLETIGLNVTVHAPFSDLNIASFNEKIRGASLEILEETIRLASELEAKAVTVHPGHCSPVSRKYQAEYIEIHRRSLRALSMLSAEYGIPVGVENMPKFPILDAQTPERLALLVDGIAVGITFDIGHLNTTTRDFEGFLKLFGERIVAVHMHDNHGKSDEHLTPGEGTVPWEEVLRKLPKVPWILEVKGIEEGVKGYTFIKSALK